MASPGFICIPPASKVTHFPIKAYVSSDGSFFRSKITTYGSLSLPYDTARRRLNQSFSSSDFFIIFSVVFFHGNDCIIVTICSGVLFDGGRFTRSRAV
jgi:hypothetical protein